MNVPNGHHLGLENTWERRESRLKAISKYSVLEFDMGITFIAETNGESGDVKVSNNTKEAMERLGIE